MKRFAQGLISHLYPEMKKTNPLLQCLKQRSPLWKSTLTLTFNLMWNRQRKPYYKYKRSNNNKLSFNNSSDKYNNNSSSNHKFNKYKYKYSSKISLNNS